MALIAQGRGYNGVRNSPRPRLQPRVRHFAFVRCAMCVQSCLGSNSQSLRWGSSSFLAIYMLRAHSSWVRGLRALRNARDYNLCEQLRETESRAPDTAALDNFINAAADNVSEISPCCSDSEDESPPAFRAWVPRSACNAKRSGYNRL